MKKIFLLMLFIVLTIKASAQPAPVTPSGSGTFSDPYQVATLANLYWVTQTSTSWGSYFKQTADIDASTTSGWDGGLGFLPIGNSLTNFAGVYDGSGHTITGLFINRSTTNVGMFFRTQGTISNPDTIKNLGLVNVSITGNSNVGGLVGQTLAHTFITNCYTTGSVTGSSHYIGGLIGYSISNISKCYSAAAVSSSGGGNVGGLAGYIAGSDTVSNCYSTGSVSGNGSVGGLVGKIAGPDTVSNCYSTGSVSSSTPPFGGLVGTTGSGVVVTNSFWDTTTSGQSTSAGGTGKTTPEMTTVSTFASALWLFGSVWEINPNFNNGYPTLSWQYAVYPSGTGTSVNPYQVSSFGNLLWVINHQEAWNSYFQQTVDINLTDSVSWYEGPIGNPISTRTARQFNGVYDGASHTITGLHIMQDSSDYVGMFGDVFSSSLNPGTIKNLGLVNVNISGRSNVGGLVGRTNGNMTVTNCYTSGSVTGDSINVGGLVGQIGGSTVISKSYSAAAVSSSGRAVSSGKAVGGLVGLMSSSTVSNCYSTGSVSGNASVGGLMGNITNGGTVSNCYSAGSVSGAVPSGGLVGVVSAGTITNSFWDMTTSGWSTSSGAGAIGEPTDSMKTQSTFTSRGWDFTSTWAMAGTTNSGYPYLQGVAPLPVELAAFTAVVNGNNVNLKWQTATEVNNYGFEIQRSEVGSQQASSSTSPRQGWNRIGFVGGAGNSNAPKYYSFTDQPTGGTSFSYRLKQIDNDGHYKYYDAITVTLKSSGKAELMDNYPNPFNPTTAIKFFIPNSSDVTIKIYDILGREVTTLVNNQTEAGYHIVYWNGRDSYGRDAASGVYLYRLTVENLGGSRTGSFSETKKMSLLR